MLIFFGIINQQESNMNEREIIIQIDAILRVARQPIDGGWEISNRDMILIQNAIRSALNQGESLV
jgi:hypothetical protein